MSGTIATRQSRLAGAAASLAVALAATPAAAQGLDGVYLGKLNCEVLVG